jgi:hypothetical protein
MSNQIGYFRSVLSLILLSLLLNGTCYAVNQCTLNCPPDSTYAPGIDQLLWYQNYYEALGWPAYISYGIQDSQFCGGYLTMYLWVSSPERGAGIRLYAASRKGLDHCWGSRLLPIQYWGGRGY